eukprot:TRINITY_DN58554_c0_g1_i1.p1 TRINITY_DN58554_c0_g1~~TRINITY_DN58554_c0_g1_i1.p1  ORF type:complete len:776 (+),score=202.49 TRINITY_DN58554_c0_g1_i1:66-2393(+)
MAASKEDAAVLPETTSPGSRPMTIGGTGFVGARSLATQPRGLARPLSAASARPARPSQPPQRPQSAMAAATGPPLALQQPARPSSAVSARRPMSGCRYVQQTLNKLSEDSARVCSRPSSASAAPLYKTHDDLTERMLREVRQEMTDSRAAETAACLAPAGFDASSPTAGDPLAEFVCTGSATTPAADPCNVAAAARPLGDSVARMTSWDSELVIAGDEEVTEEFSWQAGSPRSTLHSYSAIEAPPPAGAVSKLQPSGHVAVPQEDRMKGLPVDDLSQGASAQTVEPPMTIQEEASQCLQAVKSMVETANASALSKYVGEWQQFDFQARLQLQRHIDELVTLHQHLRKFEVEYLSSDPFSGFRSCMEELRSSVHALELTRRHNEQHIGDVAHHAAAMAVEKVWSDARATWDAIEKRQESQALLLSDRHMAEDERWTRVEAQLRHLEDLVVPLKALPTRQEVAEEVGRCRSSLSEQVAGLACEQQEEKFLKATEGHLLTLEGNLAAAKQVYIETSDQLRQEVGAMGVKLDVVGGRLQLIDDSARQDLRDEHGREVSKLQGDLASLRKELDDAARQAATKSAEAMRLEKELASLNDVVGDAKAALTTAKAAPLAQAIRGLKSVEARGNIRLNLETGEVEVLRKLLFAAPVNFKEQQPPSFKHEDFAGDIFTDVSELQGLLGSRLAVDCVSSVLSRNGLDAGSPAFWHELAVARAEKISAELAERGVSDTQKEVQGRVAKLRSPELISFKFESQDLFSKRGGGRGGSSKSPSRSRGFVS